MSDGKELVKIRSALVNQNEVLTQVAAIQNIMSVVMKEGTHYGTIEGCNQPSLYKAGSESLLSAFHIAVDPEVTAIRDGDHIIYNVRCKGVHMETGYLVGVGVGECSTAEDKYAWRGAVCDEEFDATPETHKRKKFGKIWEGGQKTVGAKLQVRTNPADIANTCLKMAKKRAQIDLCLTALAASDIFTQDIEDLPEEYQTGLAQSDKKKTNKPQPKSAQSQQPTNSGGEQLATPPQVGLMKKQAGFKNITETELCNEFKVDTVESIPKGKVNDVLAWINTHA